MAAFDVDRTATGAEWKNGSIAAVAASPYVEKGQVRAVLTVTKDKVIVFKDRVNLTTKRDRKRVVAEVAEKNVDLDPLLLLSLELACAKPTPAAAEDAPMLEGPPPPLADVLDQVKAYLCSYVAFPGDAQADATTLWTVHTHFIEQADTSPILAITSPEKRSGKTRLMDALEFICARSWRAVLPSEAVVHRKIAADTPTLLLDEVDAIFGAKTANQHECLRALLNAGNRRGVTVPRVVGEGKSMGFEEFSVFSAKAVAGIGALPDTVADRSIPIRMRRRTREEEVQRFRYVEAKAKAAPIHAALAHHAANIDVASMRPEIPDALDDRAADGWEPLLALADVAGGVWPERARTAAKALNSEREPSDESLAVELLSDIRVVFAARKADRLWTTDLLEALHRLEEAPWDDLFGRPLKAQGLARHLRTFGVSSRDVRIGSIVKKGYIAEDFTDAFGRYLDTSPPPSGGGSKRYTATNPDPRYELSDSDQADCSDVAAQPLSQRGVEDDLLESDGAIAGSFDTCVRCGAPNTMYDGEGNALCEEHRDGPEPVERSTYPCPGGSGKTVLLGQKCAPCATRAVAEHFDGMATP